MTTATSIEQPAHWLHFTKSPIALSGRYRDASGQPARSVRIRLGKRVIDCVSKTPTGTFRAIFRTRPGLKHLIIEAEQNDGTQVEIGRRLVCVYTGEHASRNYELWLQETPFINPPQPAPAQGPLISVLMPVYNPSERWLRQAIESVQAQTYTRWELCIADDASTAPHVRTVLADFAARDSRIKVVHRPINGHISATSNSALEQVSGDFTALLDHDDELAPQALAEIARALENRPDTQVLYTDEDKINAQGRHFSPHFKPDWNPDLLLAQNYLCHLMVYRTRLLREIGGFRLGVEGAQDWDLALRATERVPANTIIHLPQVLYHWRAIPGSTALKQNQKSYISIAARRVLTDYLARAGIAAEILPVRGGHWRLRRALPARPPRVSLIIPTRNQAGLLRNCIESILAGTHYPDFEILVIDNGSDEPATLEYFKKLATLGVKILRDEGPFNYSALNNRAAALATGEVLGFLNNDLKLISPGWLEEMVSQSLRPEVGAVGAMLYFPDGRVQHAGVVLGLAGPKVSEGIAGHAFKYFPRGHTGATNRMRVVQNYSAVTAACLLVRREVFFKVGGFDETHLAIAYNDVDFCLRLGTAGYRNVWTPFAEFYHHESASRGPDDTPAKKAVYEREYAYMRKTWGPLLDQDPAYNPNLTLVYEDFSPAWPPRTTGLSGWLNYPKAGTLLEPSARTG